MSARRISILSAVLLAAAWSAMLSGPRAHLGRAVAETDPPGKTLADKPPAPSAADSLCEDGRVGRIVEVQGVVLIKPPMQRRWTPVCGPGILQPGDWVRTDARGANAVELRLTTGARLTLGPGTLVELPSAREVKLLAGETQIVASDRAPLTLHPPTGETVEVRDTAMYRVQGDMGRLLAIDIRKPPLWLQGFQGTSVIDPLGSLVAQIDGRNEPLSLGVHAVTVDIRDQIARTVIEESFVNHTAGRLEGVFYFPLPADASISGFGMWVGDRLVEADVVEKQRAREIYETLLRERVDPGLLEWTSSNVFKARVYPIEPRSDKRIRITYTQVLPQRDNRFRYSYALPGEMLRQHPLRELTIDVAVNSVLPLAQVSCPTHPARIDKTGHAARVEFSAQHYVPDHDFEVVVELERGQPDAVLIPHRRGEDGYFMCLIGTGAGASAALPDGSRLNEGRDGETLELLVLADTSGSMDAGSRRRQQEFIAALFGGLAPEDRINLAVCDAACEWVFPQAESATEDRVAAVRDFLAGRSSLGWTDLNKAITAAAKQAAGRRGGQTHVIYVGDGVVTAGDADPVAVGKRLGATWSGGQAVTHAVSVSSRCEPLVLYALAALGGGSVRQISGESTPQRVAAEFLAELTQPGLRDVRLEFRGLRVARVYPERLPNLPLGSQQIVLGRYLPEGADQQGELVLTGSRAGKPFQSSTKIVLQDAEQGNEFIPRLWARRHLDALLQQGNSAAIRDEIIALSERFHIITPYTSLLVLESDALRERFQVSRRFQISDGQRFFAEGREQADFELRQQQMQRAGTWRLGLRQRTLEQLGQMGRDIEFLPPAWHINYLPVLEPLVSRSSRKGYSPDDLAALSMERDPARAFAHSAGGSAMGGYDAWDVDNQGDGSDFAGEGAGGRSVSDTGGDSTGHNEDLEDDPPSGRYEPQSAYESNVAAVAAVAAVVEDQYQTVGGRPRRASERTLFEGFDLEPVRKSWAASYGVPYVTSVIPVVDGQGRKSGQILGWTGDDENWLSGLASKVSEDALATGQFPRLPAPPAERSLTDRRWPDEVRQLVLSLTRPSQLAKSPKPVLVQIQRQAFDPRWDALISQGQVRAVVSPQGWLVRCQGLDDRGVVAWCDGRETGVGALALQLGRVRPATAADQEQPPLDLNGFRRGRWEFAYGNCTPAVLPQDALRTLLRLERSADVGEGRDELRVLIDTDRRVVLQIDAVRNDGVLQTERFSDFVQVAGNWWATRAETLNGQGRRTSLEAIKFTPLGPDDVQKEMAEPAAEREHTLLLREPLPELAPSVRAIAAGRATLEHRLVLADRAAALQNWDLAWRHFEAAERLAAGKPGLRWIRYALLDASGRHEPLRQQLLAEARRLAAGTSDELILAQRLVRQAAGALTDEEQVELLEVLKPLFERLAPHRQGRIRWLQLRIALRDQHVLPDRAVGWRRALAELDPHDCEAQIESARALGSTGDCEAAFASLQRALRPESRWLTAETEALRVAYVELLQGDERYPESLDCLAGWVRESPASESVCLGYLKALVLTGHEAQATDTAGRWLAEARRPGPLAADAAARLDAAVSFALGQTSRWRRDRVDERWLEPLAETVRFLAAHPSQDAIVERILRDSHFGETEPCRRVRAELWQQLSDRLDELSAARIQTLFRWAARGSSLTDQQRQQFARRLEKRWATETNRYGKNRLGAAILDVLPWWSSSAERLDFLGRQFREGPPQDRAADALQLLDGLLLAPWSDEREREALRLLPQVSAADTPDQRLTEQVRMLYRLTDACVAARHRKLLDAIPNPERLSRAERRIKKHENLLLARREFAQRLRAVEADFPPELRAWVEVERLWLEAQCGGDPSEVAAGCWAELPPDPGRSAAAYASSAGLDRMLRHRWLMILANLASRRGAKPEEFERLLRYVDGGIAAAAQDEVELATWQMYRWALLTAADRAQELEESLRQWTQQPGADHRWRRGLGYLLAERGRIAEAIAVFEAVEAEEPLDATDCRVLAGWYLAAGQRERYERATLQALQPFDEWQLDNWLNDQLQRWESKNGPPPSQLDEGVLQVLRAMLEQLGDDDADQAVTRINDFYAATKDHRVPALLADGVLGRTAGQALSYVQRLSWRVDDLFQNEAALEAIARRIAQLRPNAAADADRHALDLLELMVEAHAGLSADQPGPHVERALAVLRRLLSRVRSSSELSLRIWDLVDAVRPRAAPTRPLVDEYLQKLEQLQRAAKPGSDERRDLTDMLAYAYCLDSQLDRAQDLLEAALAELRAGSRSLPSSGQTTLDQYVHVLESRGQFARAEQTINELISATADQGQTRRLRRQLSQLYVSALAGGGEVSLGSGNALYQATRQRLLEAFDQAVLRDQVELLDQLCSLFQAAHKQGLAAAGADLRDFAFRRLPPALRQRQPVLFDPCTIRPAEVVRDALQKVCGPRDVLAFQMLLVENAPPWRRHLDADRPRDRPAARLGKLRKEVGGPLGDLEPRLLTVVIDDLKKELRAGRSGGGICDYRQGGAQEFWPDQTDRFARAAEEVYAEQDTSDEAAVHVAQYLAHGLQHPQRAIDLMLDAQRRTALGPDGQRALVELLENAKRPADAIPILQQLAAARPAEVHWRTKLMEALFRVGRREDMGRILQETDAYFHQNDRWNYAVSGELADACLEAKLYPQAVAYCEDTIAQYRRAHPASHPWDTALAHYYSSLALAYAGLKKTPEAVDAACRAIVLQGPQHERRARDLTILAKVLPGPPELDEYVALVDRRAAETGTDNPAVRTAMGRSYADYHDERAVTQLRIACGLDPSDAEPRRRLVRFFDRAWKQEAAIGELLALSALTPKDLDLYRDLGRRYERLGRPADAERAYTSIVEAVPNEAAGHATLAEIRQEQDRWPDAVSHWQQAARLSATDPTALLKLAAAQIHLRDWTAVRTTLQELRSTAWPARFADVASQTEELAAQIEQ